MKKKDEIKVCLVGSSGGHLTHLYMLKPFWKDKNRFWVTFDKEDARSLLEGEKVYPCYFPTNRSIKALIKNTKIAWDVLHAYLLHVTTTPSVAYIARVDDFDCGIMISASHNPYYDNGIKLIDCYGEKMPEETLLLVEDYIDGKLHVFDKDWPELPFAHREHIGCTVDYVAGRNRYMGYLISLGIYSFKGVKVGLDCANAGKVPSPAARKLQSGAKLSLHFRKSDEPLWSAKAVDRILHNEVYIGKLVQGKTRRLDYRSKKKMNVPMRDWVIVDNTHEAIIPAEQFELVRRILETETRRPNNAETVALFAGFLYCGDCGSRLVRRSASYKGKRYIYYQCSGSKQNKGSCTSHNLRDEKLHNIVRNALQMQIQIVMEEAEFVESIRQAQQEPYRVRRIERQIRQLTAEKAHTQGM